MKPAGSVSVVGSVAVGERREGVGWGAQDRRQGLEGRSTVRWRSRGDGGGGGVALDVYTRTCPYYYVWKLSPSHTNVTTRPS